jgi:Mrp family chromosome partitioning ATPase
MPMKGSTGMDLPRFMALIRARWRLIAAIVGAAILLALLLSATRPDRYTASADLLFGQTTAAEEILAGGATTTTELPETTTATNLQLASLDTVAASVAKKLPGTTIDELKSAVSVRAAGDSNLVTVTAEWGTATGAARVANAFADAIVTSRRAAAEREIQRGIDALAKQLPKIIAPTDTAAAATQARINTLEALKDAQTAKVQVVEAATPPDNRSSPTPLRNAFIAALAALLLAVFLVVLLARFDDPIGDEDDLTDMIGAPVLTRIPDVGDSLLLTQTWYPNQEPGFLEAFEFLRLNLDLMGHDRGSAVLAVTSPKATDGKTTVVAWLARSLALNGAEVVAVDLDVRNPQLHNYFDFPEETGNGVLDALLELTYDREDAADGAAGRDGNGEAQLVEAGATHGRRAYSDEDINVGLAELVRCRGNTRRAARSLSAAGHDIPESALRRWRDDHPELYAEMRAARRRGTVAAPHLRLLAGNNHPQLPAGLIARGRLEEMFAELRQDAEFVLVDTVPVSTVADASAVAAAADGVILVVDLNSTRRKDLLAAKQQLAHARAKIVGVVVNRARADIAVYHAPGPDHWGRALAKPPLDDPTQR